MGVSAAEEAGPDETEEARPDETRRRAEAPRVTPREKSVVDASAPVATVRPMYCTTGWATSGASRAITSERLLDESTLAVLREPSSSCSPVCTRRERPDDWRPRRARASHSSRAQTRPKPPLRCGQSRLPQPSRWRGVAVWAGGSPRRASQQWRRREAMRLRLVLGGSPLQFCRARERQRSVGEQDDYLEPGRPVSCLTASKLACFACLTALFNGVR